VLTKTKVDSLIQKKKACSVSDIGERKAGVLKLEIRVLKTKVSAEWRLQWTRDGKKRRMKLGDAGKDGMSLAKAREEYRTASQDIQAGLDPREAKAKRERDAKLKQLEATSSGSLDELFRGYVDKLVSNKKKSWKQVENALLKGKYAAIKSLGTETKAHEVKPEHIKAVLATTHKRAESMAAHLRSYLHAAFEYGIGHEYDYTDPDQDMSFLLESNPVSAIRRNAKAFKKGDRKLSIEELRHVWHNMQFHGVSYKVHTAIKLIIAVAGVRVQGIVNAPIYEFDFDEQVWSIPGERIKNSREHVTPLGGTAMHLIGELQQYTGGISPLLFPRRNNDMLCDQPICFTSLTRAVSRFCKNTGMKKWTPRDLRRSFRTILVDEDVEDYLLNRYFNHGMSDVGNDHYNRSKMIKSRKKVLRTWENVLASIVKGDGRE